MVWVFSLEWLWPVFGTSLSLVIAAHTYFSLHLPHSVDLVSQCVQSVMCQQDMSLSWNCMNLYWIPNLLILAAQTQVYCLNCSGYKSEQSLNQGLYTKLVLTWDRQPPPHMGVLTFQLRFFTWLLWTSSLESFKSNHSKKNIPVWFVWFQFLIDPNSPEDQILHLIDVVSDTQILHQRNWNWGDISWDMEEWGYLAELEDVESPGYQIQRLHYSEKRMEREGPGSSPPSQALLWLHMNSKTREVCPALELGRGHWCTWMAPQ